MRHERITIQSNNSLEFGSFILSLERLVQKLCRFKQRFTDQTNTCFLLRTTKVSSQIYTQTVFALWMCTEVILDKYYW